jgi:hypothetical protein
MWQGLIRIQNRQALHFDVQKRDAEKPPNSTEWQFTMVHNRKMMDLAIINVTRLN